MPRLRRNTLAFYAGTAAPRPASAHSRDPRCTMGYGWSVVSPVHGGSWGHWRTRAEAEADDALSRFLAAFNHPGRLVCHHDWWPQEQNDAPAAS